MRLSDVIVGLVCVCEVKLKFDQCTMCDSEESELMKTMIYPMEEMRRKLQDLVTKAHEVSTSHYTYMIMCFHDHTVTTDTYMIDNRQWLELTHRLNGKMMLTDHFSITVTVTLCLSDIKSRGMTGRNAS